MYLTCTLLGESERFGGTILASTYLGGAKFPLPSAYGHHAGAPEGGRELSGGGAAFPNGSGCYWDAIGMPLGFGNPGCTRG